MLKKRSRVAKLPVPFSKSVKVTSSVIEGVTRVTVKGPNGEESLDLHPSVQVIIGDTELQIQSKVSGERTDSGSNAQAGTTRSLLMNLVTGVEKGFERRLLLVGVGYRAQAKGKALNLTVGHSHPVELTVPDGVRVETPSQTEIVLLGANKQKLGQFAADVRSVRAPECYKGKGIRYGDEKVRIKAKKK